MNGRTYVATASARLSRLALGAILLSDLAIIFFLRRWILALLTRYLKVVTGAAVVGVCTAAVMIASGGFGLIPTGSPAKYPGLVLRRPM